MPEKSVFKAAPVVRALKITLITLLILYGLVFIGCAGGFVVLLLPPFALKPCPALWDEIKVVIDKVLTGPVYFYIAYCVFKLIGLVSRGEPFSPASPRHIRRIGYAVFVLALLHTGAAAIGEFNIPGVSVNWTEAVLRILYSGLSTLLLGFGFLVIAKVIETGVALKQDQDLTV